jgi:hypothetical protein
MSSHYYLELGREGLGHAGEVVSILVSDPISVTLPLELLARLAVIKPKVCADVASLVASALLTVEI